MFKLSRISMSSEGQHTYFW